MAPPSGGTTPSHHQKDRKSSMKIFGTSGSPAFLQDSTAGHRFWLASPEEPPPSLTDEDRQRIQDLVRRRADEGGEVCDGLHDVSAPEQYLCSRCFPEGLATDDADDEEEIA